MAPPLVSVGCGVTAEMVAMYEVAMRESTGANEVLLNAAGSSVLSTARRE